jgi:GDPmannose 4,6-dehydratase
MSAVWGPVQTFVTRKITRSLANMAQGLGRCLYMTTPRRPALLGPRQGLRAHVVADAAQEKPEDFVIANGVQYSVR